MTTPNIESVRAALSALGEAHRGDWAFFDGRTLRAQLDEVAAVLGSDQPVSYETMCRSWSVCPVNRCWYEHCSDAIGTSGCAHDGSGEGT